MPGSTRRQAEAEGMRATSKLAAGGAAGAAAVPRRRRVDNDPQQMIDSAARVNRWLRSVIVSRRSDRDDYDDACWHLFFCSSPGNFDLTCSSLDERTTIAAAPRGCAFSTIQRLLHPVVASFCCTPTYFSAASSSRLSPPVTPSPRLARPHASPARVPQKQPSHARPPSTVSELTSNRLSAGAASYRDSPIELQNLAGTAPTDPGPRDSSTPDQEYRWRRKRERKYRQLLERQAMKFSHSVQFNAVPEWTSHYINYSNLKKLIYTLEKSLNAPHGFGVDGESSPLLTEDRDPDPTFLRALDSELEKICTFYQVKELEIYGELADLLKDHEEYISNAAESPILEQEGRTSQGGRQRRSSIFGLGLGRPRRQSTSQMSASIDRLTEEDSDDDDADETAALRSKPPERRKTDASERMQGSQDLMSQSQRWQSQGYEDWGDQSFALYDSAITLKKRLVSMYVSLCELKSFIQLNKTGFTKALKKYDKILDRSLKSKYVENSVKSAYPFQADSMRKLDENISKVEKAYASVITKGDESLARRELRLHLREHVVWERNTVWREMIGVERKAQAANLGIRRTLLGGDGDPKQGDEQVHEATKEVVTPVGRYRCPKWLFSSTFFTLLAIITVFVVMLWVPIMEKPEQQNCLAMLVFVSLLWATEVIPLFVTSLVIPFLSVVLRVSLSDYKPYKRLEPPEAAKHVFAAMWTPVIMLLLGGFTIAAALSKYQIAKVMATFVLSKAGTKPRTVLITNMFVAMIASMWISNVASPVLCYSIVQPLLRNLPPESNFSKALILGIALASNIGGMSSPIASPQNIIALENMHPDPSWLKWFFIALPVSIISILMIWVLLLITFQPSKGTTIVPIRPVRDKFSGVQWFISFVTLATIILWCVSHQLDNVFGDMGVIAIIPMVLFFGTGILTKEDFNNFLWTIIILAAGGLSLGKAVSGSGLLHTIANAITEGVEDFSLYGVLVVFAAVTLVIATFISHTVAALIILPLVRQVGSNMDNPHPNLLVMAIALMCSAAMGLPTSGFPNMTAIMMEDNDTGKRYLKVSHFLTRGIPSSILTFAVVITIGYGLMLAVGF